MQLSEQVGVPLSRTVPGSQVSVQLVALQLALHRGLLQSKLHALPIAEHITSPLYTQAVFVPQDMVPESPPAASAPGLGPESVTGGLPLAKRPSKSCAHPTPKASRAIKVARRQRSDM